MFSRTLVVLFLSGCSVGHLDLDGKAREKAEAEFWPGNSYSLGSAKMLDVHNYADDGVSLFAQGLESDIFFGTNQLLVPAKFDQPFYRQARRTETLYASPSNGRSYQCEAATVGLISQLERCRFAEVEDRTNPLSLPECGDVDARVVGRSGIAPCPMADNAYRVIFDAKTDRLWMTFAENSTPQELSRISIAYNGGWRRMETANSPEPIVDPVGFVFGNRVLFFGRSTAGSLTGGIYEPNKDKWSAISGEGIPAGGGAFRTLWIGEKLYVFVAKGGAVYDPAVDAWRTLRSEGAPTFGDSFVAAYDDGGRRVFLYGISQGGGGTSFSVGGIYDLQNDTWSDYAVASGPVATSFAGAAWTGTEFLVWSDQAAGRAVFYPQTGQWVPFEKVAESLARSSLDVPNRVLTAGGNVVLLPSGHQYERATGKWTMNSVGSVIGLKSSIYADKGFFITMGDTSDLGVAGYDLSRSKIIFPKSKTTPEARTGAAVARVGNHLVYYGGCEKKVNDRCQVFSRGGAVVEVLPYR